MNVLIYGYGTFEGGFAAARYFHNKGCKVRVTDLREESALGEGIHKLKELGIEIIAGSHRVEDFKWADLVIKTPAISLDNPFLDYAKSVSNDYSYLFENENVAKTKLICVTGTRGKTITTEAVCHALRKMDKKARICGSADSPVFKELENWEKSNVPEYLICKMSSWQIRDINYYCEGFIPTVELAVFTSSVQGERYEMFGKQARYILCPQENKLNVKETLNVSLRKISLIENNAGGMTKDIPANLQMAYAILRRLGFKSKDINNALKSFKGVPHKMEIVSTKDNLLVINDSATTIPETVGFTMRNIETAPIHLICGGSGKNLKADPLVETCKGVASLYLLDGSFTQKELIPKLKDNNIDFYGPFKTITEAVDEFKKNYDSDTKKVLQVLLLSPGAPASEFFTDEFDRGNKFKACFK